MVIYELLSHSKQTAAHEAGAVEKGVERFRAAVESTAPKPPAKPVVQKQVLPPKEKAAVGSVSRFISENVSTAKDAKTEMREPIRGYRDWCTSEGLRAIDLNKALDEVEALCSQIARPAGLLRGSDT